MAECMQTVLNCFKDIPSSLFDFATMLVAVVSAICAFLAYRNQRNRGKKAAACELAKYYADNIIKRSAFLWGVYSSSKYADLIKEAFPIDCIFSFTRQEMEETLKRANIPEEKVASAMHTIDPDTILANKAIYMGLGDAINIMQDFIPKEESDMKAIHLLIQSDFSDALNTHLNELEWFSMQCRYGVADEGLLYQSLHQTFLSDVQMLYFHISSRNCNSEDKLFTNIVWLFQTWKARLEKFKKKNQAEIARADKKLKKAQEEAKRAGRSVHHGKSI